MTVPQVRPRDVADRRARGEAFVLLDVREPFELELARVGGTLDIPMNTIPERLAEIPKDRDVVVMCHHGGRSGVVAAWLAKQGYRASNLAGGIAAWARDVDPDVGSY
ncbi:MAG TPA: rhodanese-like domain-containing protein [Candidatus Thermoplasmatota archaeon]|nr:rhodanese-like domain-containing protein [Candidatus Thermoplasmatota archaeon]